MDGLWYNILMLRIDVLTNILKVVVHAFKIEKSIKIKNELNLAAVGMQYHHDGYDNTYPVDWRKRGQV